MSKKYSIGSTQVKSGLQTFNTWLLIGIKIHKHKILFILPSNIIFEYSLVFEALQRNWKPLQYVFTAQIRLFS